jgi:RNA polymerase sigma factor (sigma-70 family)
VEPWLLELHQGRTQAAWDLFAERYRRLSLATIRRLLRDEDDVMDVYSSVCEALLADDCARLRRYSDQAGKGARPASVATWLVVVVRNLTIDWRRRRDGRWRPTVPPGLSPLQREIHLAVCGERCSTIEAYERIRTRGDTAMPFAAFLREVRATLRLAPCPSDPRLHMTALSARSEGISAESADPIEATELASRLAAALASYPDDIRVAVELFVVERMPADDVARAVGWPNAKAVYNRVYRALASVRAGFVRDGIGPGDL